MEKEIKEFRLDLDSGNILDKNNQVWTITDFIEYKLINTVNTSVMLWRFQELNFDIQKLRDFYLNGD